MEERKRNDDDVLRLWQALLLALLVHLVLAWILERSPEAFASYFQLSPELLEQEEQPPLRFEFVDIPDEPEVQPEIPKAVSDRSRRARAEQRPEQALEPEDPDPYAEGNTPQKVQVPPAPPVQQEAAPLQERDLEQETSAGTGAVPPGTGADIPRSGESGEAATVVPPQSVPERSLLQAIPRLSEVELRESFDNRGGFSPMELGTVSFDTAAIDWGPYARQMVRVIRRNWIERLPPAARTGLRGVAVVSFRIARSGEISNVALIDSYGVRLFPPDHYQVTDGIRPFESTAMESIEVSELPPLPDIFTEPDVGVTIGFYYNLIPPR